MLKLYTSVLCGRQGRVAFFLELLPVLLPLLLLYTLMPAGQLPPVVLASGLWLVGTALAALLAVRRLHDLGRSGWYAMLLITPLLNMAMLAVLLVLPGVPRATRPQPSREVSLVLKPWQLAAA